jgi:hypothetical protein
MPQTLEFFAGRDDDAIRFSLAQAFMPGIAAVARVSTARFSGLTGLAALAIGAMSFRG